MFAIPMVSFPFCLQFYGAFGERDMLIYDAVP